MSLRYRLALVHMKIRVKNAIHAILMRYHIQHTFSDLFGKKGCQFLANLKLPPTADSCLQGWMQLLAFLEDQLKQAKELLYEQCDQNRQVQLLMTMPGIDRFTVHLILAEIGELPTSVGLKSWSLTTLAAVLALHSYNYHQ